MGWRGKAAVGISLGMTATLGGLVSVPLWGTAMTVWRQLFSDGDDPERKLYNWAYKNGGKNAADVLFYGMPSMAGVTISGSLGMELPILQDLKGDKPWGRQILSSGMEIFGVPVAMLEKIGNTFEFAGKGDYWRATEEALPTAASNIMKAIRLADEGMTTRSGKPIADGTGRPIKLSKSESRGQGSRLPARPPEQGVRRPQRPVGCGSLQEEQAGRTRHPLPQGLPSQGHGGQGRSPAGLEGLQQQDDPRGQAPSRHQAALPPRHAAHEAQQTAGTA